MDRDVYAAKAGVLRTLLKAGGRCETTAPMLVAVGAGDIELVGALIAAGAPVKGDKTVPVLFECLRTRNEGARLPMVQMLLKAGAPANEAFEIVYQRNELSSSSETVSGRTSVVAEAALLGATEIFHSLLEEGSADPNLGAGLCRMITYSAPPSAIHALLRAGADANVKDAEGHSALYLGLREKNEAVVQLLLGNGCDLSKELEAACAVGTPELVRQCLEAGADAREALRWVAQPSEASREVVDMLLKAGADATLGLPRIVKNGDLASVGILLGRGANPSQKEEEYPLTAACSITDEKVRAAMVKMLLDAGADIGAGTSEFLGRSMGTPLGDRLLVLPVSRELASAALLQLLQQACPDNGFNVGPAIALLEAGADPNYSSSSGTTPLGVVLPLLSGRGQPDVMGLLTALLEHGADVGRKFVEQRRERLCWATSLGTMEYSSSKPKTEVCTAWSLLVARQMVSSDVAHLLLRYTKVNEADELGVTVLGHVLSRAAKPDRHMMWSSLQASLVDPDALAISLIADYGADVNAPTRNPRHLGGKHIDETMTTPLCVAIQARRHSMVRYLIQRGARVDGSAGRAAVEAFRSALDRTIDDAIDGRLMTSGGRSEREKKEERPPTEMEKALDIIAALAEAGVEVVSEGSGAWRVTKSLMLAKQHKKRRKRERTPEEMMMEVLRGENSTARTATDRLEELRNKVLGSLGPLG